MSPTRPIVPFGAYQLYGSLSNPIPAIETLAARSYVLHPAAATDVL